MTRLQFIILTSLSVVVALCVFLQMFLVHATAADETRLRATGAALNEGQTDFNRLQQVANWTAALAQKENDQNLRDILTQNNIQVKNSPAPDANSSSSTPATSGTPSTSSTH
jgi:hypothetical protein